MVIVVSVAEAAAVAAKPQLPPFSGFPLFRWTILGLLQGIFLTGGKSWSSVFEMNFSTRFSTWMDLQYSNGTTVLERIFKGPSVLQNGPWNEFPVLDSVLVWTYSTWKDHQGPSVCTRMDLQYFNVLSVVEKNFSTWIDLQYLKWISSTRKDLQRTFSTRIELQYLDRSSVLVWTFSTWKDHQWPLELHSVPVWTFNTWIYLKSGWNKLQYLEELSVLK